MEKNIKARVIALYLPQFYPIPENDEWWGKGFTEWTNVGKAKPLFWGHEQPKVPADLGYYDLRLSETRIAQAEMAKDAGIEGFCYWHYWFGNGKRLLEKPFNEVLVSGKPDFPFCLGWANHSWEKKTWQQNKYNKLLIKQTYNGINDYKEHFNTVLKAFKDKRYIRVDEKPLFLIWSPHNLPSSTDFINLWNRLAIENGLKGIFFIAYNESSKTIDKLITEGYDAVALDLLSECSDKRSFFKKAIYKVLRFLFSIPRIINYKDYAHYFTDIFPLNQNVMPVIAPNFDHSPRSGKRAIVLTHSTPNNWGILFTSILEKMKTKPLEQNIIFLKSWNEWGEGNYLEPDTKYGRQYIDVIKKNL